MSHQVYFVDCSIYQNGKQTDLQGNVLALKKSYTCIVLVISISFMLLCHVHIKAKTSRFSFDEVLKLTF